MAYNYQALDAVFMPDCPICAVNLKHMWCEYACNVNKASFLEDAGTTRVNGLDYQNVIFTIDSGYACGVFQSCERESFIA